MPEQYTVARNSTTTTSNEPQISQRCKRSKLGSLNVTRQHIAKAFFSSPMPYLLVSTPFYFPLQHTHRQYHLHGGNYMYHLEDSPFSTHSMILRIKNDNVYLLYRNKHVHITYICIQLQYYHRNMFRWYSIVFRGVVAISILNVQAQNGYNKNFTCLQ